MEKLYAYLKSKLKQKNLRLEQFASICGFSKSTLYRYMKGIQPIPQNVEIKICEVLDLDEYESQKLHNILNTSNMDIKLFKSRETLYKIIFSNNFEIPEYSDRELIFYDRDRYIRNVSEIFKNISKFSENKNFICDMNIVGCIDDEIMGSVQKLVNQKSIKNGSLKIEHIVNIPNTTYDEAILVLKSILPMFQTYNYDVYYTDYDSNSSYISIVNDFLIMRCSYTNEFGNSEEKYIFIAFVKDNFSGCYMSTDRNLYNFFIQSYSCIKQKCKKNLIRSKNFEIINKRYENLKKNSNIYFFQPSFGYSRIPLKLLEAEFAKYKDEQIISIANFLSDKRHTVQTSKIYISHLLEEMDKKNSILKSHINIDIYSKAGIEDFISTGIVKSHFENTIPFSKQCICTIMKNLIQQDLNSNYKMYISDDTISNKMRIGVIKESGIFIDYSNQIQKRLVISNLFIESDSLCEVFSDFVENYLPQTNILSGKSAYNFIETLLNKYC